ncbi:hypothetical protein [Qipengyuania sp. ASV99]|uniref:hypothetical protein n=1 Tax=Qipengyuania sp. ASV99 TaxID=3399681 RepID=UPI003A4C54CE
MTRRSYWIGGAAALALVGAGAGGTIGTLATAQNAPESLLPPGFDDPAPAPTPTPRPSALPTAAPAGPASGPAPQGGAQSPATVQPLPPGPQVSQEELSDLPSLEELEGLSTDQLDDLLGLKPKFDIPPAARRSMAQAGVLSMAEGGLPTRALAKQPPALVRAILTGTNGPLVSRWGHILLRRAMASRLNAPEGMDPIEFASLRARVLNSLGEFAVTRALAQDIDTSNWSTAMTSQALAAYIASADLVGACPAVRLQGGARDNPRWVMMQAICNAYAGEGALAGSQLNAAQSRAIAPEIDLLLAQRYAGAAGRGRGGTTVSWEGVEELTPWRFAIANAVGEDIPEGLIERAIAAPRGIYYPLSAATAPMLTPAQRALYADVAAGQGVLSAAAMVDIYSQVYSDDAGASEVSARAALLRDAYVGSDPAIRITAMQSLWAQGLTAEGAAVAAGDPGFAGHILTAYAAARIPPSADHAAAAGDLIASMLTAGLDRDAAAWAEVAEPGSLAWALVALSNPQGGDVSSDAVQSFVSGDDSAAGRKGAFLLAGLAGLGRMSTSDASALGADLTRQTRWTRMIARAAEVENPAMVALLAGLGMQGTSWAQMTPLHLYHLTSALRRVGMEAEARMIAAEAVARG